MNDTRELSKEVLEGTYSSSNSSSNSTSGSSSSSSCESSDSCGIPVHDACWPFSLTAC